MYLNFSTFFRFVGPTGLYLRLLGVAAPFLGFSGSILSDPPLHERTLGILLVTL